ncbi:xin actin-binding repeat-containing protein 2 [Chanos chanos]|uniref:Xin actin-binding repeat-containing protein 2 n=1 Tax=Chanos chanos TaxID=29144 RepID=A0A6J2WE24_CHACN|nr:xin actin-binding repeat-containing protein 2 [Chanos chanos]
MVEELGPTDLHVKQFRKKMEQDNHVNHRGGAGKCRKSHHFQNYPVAQVDELISTCANAAAGSVVRLQLGRQEEADHQRGGALSEPIPLQSRRALYQAAVYNQANTSYPSLVMEEAEVCSLPGGLASVRRQFESEETSTAHSAVTQFHFTHRTVQETSNSVQLSANQQALFFSDEKISHEQNIQQDVTTSIENHHDETGEEEEYYPRLSARELAQHFEKTIEEAAPSKKIKTERDITQNLCTSIASVSQHTSKSEICETVTETTAEEEEYLDSVSATDGEELDYLPPPPPDLLEEPSELPEYFPEPPDSPNPIRHPMNREQYFKQRELLELKRLCKHVHPDVRKDLEREFYDEVTDEEREGLLDDDGLTAGDVQEAAYAFENGGSTPNRSPEREYLEWDEILRGEVQSMCWMFENKPLDCIKDDSSDEEEGQDITKQEVITGSDVRSTALMFETQPMDLLGVDHSSAQQKQMYNNVAKGDVRTAAWLFETKPMDTLNKLYKDEEQTKEVVFTQEVTKGDVNSVRYMFENQQMDSFGVTETIDEKHLLNLKSVLEEIKTDVKKVIWMFETQCMCLLREHSGEMVEITSVRREETEKGDVKTSRWLFETKPLGEINENLSQVRLISGISIEDNQQGDIKKGRWLFETKRLDSINEEWEKCQKAEKEEIIGADVRKHCLVFETQPMDTLKDDTNARPATPEEIIGGDVRSVRHFFESAPKNELKELAEVGKLKKMAATEEERGDVRHQKWKFENQHLENIGEERADVGRLKKTVASEEERGDVRHQRWLFENQKLEDIREERKELVRMVNLELNEENISSFKGDVQKNCWVFETQPMDTLKDDSNAKPVITDEIIGGDVRSARHFFETAPKEQLKELAEVGKLKKVVASEEERGDVRHQKWRFESQPLEQIGEEKKQMTRTVNVEDVEKVDVRNYKQIFETTDLSRHDQTQKIQVEGVTTGSVKLNKDLFESTPLYAMQDSSGHYHEVKTIRREEVVKGDVRSFKWMFETRPIDQFDESITKFQIIKGITQQEIESGDVKTAKWLFETQPLDAIKYFSNIEDEEYVTRETTEIVKGDVKTCKWLFETKPMDELYERIALRRENEDDVHRGDVKTCTWLFETQALDTIRDESETVLTAKTVKQEDIQGKDVRMARFLFETENLENLTGEDDRAFKTVTEIDVQSGDVSRMKYIFETQSADVMTSTSEEFMHKLRTAQAEDIQKGNVGNCKMLFENQPIDSICEKSDEQKNIRTVMDVQGGNVDKGRFIFETYTLDKIQQASSESDISKLQKIICEEEEKGDVKNYAMMFDTQPLYAIQDKEGHYHEVTTLTKEEILKGDVVGARWLFETKPLDSIRDTDEVYLIKAVTEEDVQKGDVKSARWRFETQPLDKIAEDVKVSVKTIDDIRGGDVKTNKQRFESDLSSQRLVRTVSMSEIHKGDVRTAKWMFETRTIDQLHGENSEDEMEKVTMEEEVKGDVKQHVWLFEKNPLDSITDNVESKQTAREEIPKADVKTTTWLFETTPLPEFNESSTEKTEIIGKSIKETLDELYSQQMVASKGILIEADEIGDVRMAKYNLMNKETPEIQKEEIIKGDLKSIMMNLLNRREEAGRGVIIDADERGNVNSTVRQLFSQHTGSNVEKEEIIRGDIQEAINKLLKEESSAKRGILLQEDERGDVRMTIYSLFNKQEDLAIEKEDIIKGDVKSTLQRLYCPENQEQVAKIKVDDAEKGKVSFYSTCIESGALDYLKQLQTDVDETLPGKVEKEQIIGGDIKGMKLSLERNQAQIERTVDKEYIVPGDVHNTVKVFMTEPSTSLSHSQREEIVRGDLRAAMNSLTRSINQAVVLEKEEVVKGDIPTTLRSLREAQYLSKEVEKPEIVPGDIKGALKSLKGSATTKTDIVVEDLVPGDIKSTLKLLEEAKQVVREVEKEEIVKGDIHTAMQSLQEASNERKIYQQEIGVQGDVKGTIQLLLEPPPSPRMQRRPSTEGDVKLSIKSLYEMQEQVQSEKEEVIKGDVKGTIKCLLETAQRASPKIPRKEPIRRVKVPAKNASPSQQEFQALRPTPAIKNLSKSNESQRNVQKIATAKSMQNEYISQERNEVTSHTTSSSTHESETTILEHKTIVQTHGIKTLKTEFRNLKTNHKGLIRLDKDKSIQEIPIPPPAATPPVSELPLPLPPPPPECDNISFPAIRQDNDLPPPPSPPPPPPPPPSESEKADLDLLPPPPPMTEQDFLPPPPSQQELDSMPSQALNITPTKPTKMTVKPVKAPTLHKVPKLEAPQQFKEMEELQTITASQVITADETAEKISKTQIRSHSSSVSSTVTSLETQSSVSLQAPESPRPPKKVFTSPRMTPPSSPTPSTKSKSHLTKFQTPLIKAEKKYRQQREESTPPNSPAFEIHMHESVSAALEMLSTEATSTVQSEQSISFDFTREKAEKSVTKAKSEPASRDSLKHVKLSDVPPSEPFISSANEKSPLESADISSAKQHIISHQTSEASSTQHQTTSTSTKKKKRRSMTTNIQQVTAASTTQSVISQKTQLTAAEKASYDAKEPENALKNVNNKLQTDVKKDIKDAQAKEHIQSEDNKKINSPSPKSQRKSLPDSTKIGKGGTENKVSETEPKVQKTENQKTKKSIKPVTQEPSEKKATYQTETVKVEQESVQVRESIDKKQTEIEAKVEKETKQKQVEEAPVSTKDSKPESRSKKRRKAKKEKETGQQTKSNISSGPSEPQKPVSTSVKKQEEITVVQSHKAIQGEHIQVHKEVIITESKVQQSFQQQGTVKLQKQVKASQKKKEESTNQQIHENSKDDSRNVPIKVTGKPEQNKSAKPVTESAETSQRYEQARKLLSQITGLQEASGKIDSKSVKTLLNEIPEWLIEPKEKSDLEGAAVKHNEQKLKEIIAHVKTLIQEKLTGLQSNTMNIEKHECEPTSENIDFSGTTQRISKITIGSKKVETQKKVVEEKKASHKSQKQQERRAKMLDPRAPSPSLRMRSPSPTFITIESTRRTDSPQRIPPSPPPMPPTPPPRRSETPRVSRASPSPTRKRADSLARLRDATAKLSRGASPDPVPHPVQVTERKAEIVESPASFHRQIKVETKTAEPSETADMLTETVSVKDRKEFFEEAQRAEENKTHVPKNPINIPERLGPEIEEPESEKIEKEKENLPKVDLSELVSKFESPQVKKPTVIPERLRSETEDLEPKRENKTTQQKVVPDFDNEAIKNVFKMVEQHSSVKEQKGKKEGKESEVSESLSKGSKQDISQASESNSLPLHSQHVTVEKSVKPNGFSETKTVTEHSQSVDEFGTKISESRSTRIISQHSESVTTRSVPFSYADAVKRKPTEAKEPEKASASAEELLNNFHKTWTESENVFRSLGYSVSDSSPKVGDVHSMQEEGLPHGVSEGRQKELP